MESAHLILQSAPEFQQAAAIRIRCKLLCSVRGACMKNLSGSAFLCYAAFFYGCAALVAGSPAATRASPHATKASPHGASMPMLWPCMLGLNSDQMELS